MLFIITYALLHLDKQMITMKHLKNIEYACIKEDNI